MPVKWKIFRVTCFLQMLAAIFSAFISLINLFRAASPGYFLFYFFVYSMIAWLAITGINLLNSNYPDQPVSGSQKTAFNWVFLINFLLIVILFANLFIAWRDIKVIAHFLGRQPLSLPFRFMTGFYLSSAILLFQFIILYGLYTLRRELYRNFFRNKQFEFEN